MVPGMVEDGVAFTGRGIRAGKWATLYAGCGLAACVCAPGVGYIMSAGSLQTSFCLGSSPGADWLLSCGSRQTPIIGSGTNSPSCREQVLFHPPQFHTVRSQNNTIYILADVWSSLPQPGSSIRCPYAHSPAFSPPAKQLSLEYCCERKLLLFGEPESGHLCMSPVRASTSLFP